MLHGVVQAAERRVTTFSAAAMKFAVTCARTDKSKDTKAQPVTVEEVIMGVESLVFLFNVTGLPIFTWYSSGLGERDHIQLRRAEVRYATDYTLRSFDVVTSLTGSAKHSIDTAMVNTAEANTLDQAHGTLPSQHEDDIAIALAGADAHRREGNDANARHDDATPRAFVWLSCPAFSKCATKIFPHRLFCRVH